jgi:nitrate/nitrite transporter NarK
MAEEDRIRQQQHGPDKWQAMLQYRVWLLIAIYFTVAVGTNAGAAYFPTLVKEQYQQSTNFQIGLLTALPHLCAIVAMSLVGINSDRTGGRAHPRGRRSHCVRGRQSPETPRTSSPWPARTDKREGPPHS